MSAADAASGRVYNSLARCYSVPGPSPWPPRPTSSCSLSTAASGAFGRSSSISRGTSSRRGAERGARSFRRPV